MPLQIIVPLAGDGRRFRDAGYRLPKPLIPVAGVPMAVRAIRDLPTAERVVYVVRADHAEQYGLAEALRRHVSGCRIVMLPGPTEGQACTVLAAADELEPAWPVIAAACDNTHLYDPARFAGVLADPAIECLVWTYRRDPRVLVRPTQHGWVRVDGSRILEVSCKRPISDTPIEDHVISGCFTFRTAATMLRYIESMVAAGLRTNGEYYLDNVPNLMIAHGRRADVFEVDKYIGWGTPADLQDFSNWERFFEGIR